MNTGKITIISGEKLEETIKPFYMKKYLLFLATTCFFAMIAEAQNDTTIEKDQVKNSIKIFAKLLDSNDVKEFGFKSISELKQLMPGKQFKRYTIGLSAIKNYNQGENIANMIKEYPSIEVALINQKGKILNSIEFVKDTVKGKWVPSRYGSTPELVVLRREQEFIGDSIIKKGRLIRIPSLHVSFIAITSTTSGLVFISMVDRPNLNLFKGQKLPVSDAILRLVPYAKNHKNFPG